jgi:hypothetical protein
MRTTTVLLLLLSVVALLLILLAPGIYSMFVRPRLLSLALPAPVKQAPWQAFDLPLHAMCNIEHIPGDASLD